MFCVTVTAKGVDADTTVAAGVALAGAGDATPVGATEGALLVVAQATSAKSSHAAATTHIIHARNLMSVALIPKFKVNIGRDGPAGRLPHRTEMRHYVGDVCARRRRSAGTSLLSDRKTIAVGVALIL